MEVWLSTMIIDRADRAVPDDPVTGGTQSASSLLGCFNSPEVLVLLHRIIVRTPSSYVVCMTLHGRLIV